MSDGKTKLQAMRRMLKKKNNIDPDKNSNILEDNLQVVKLNQIPLQTVKQNIKLNDQKRESSQEIKQMQISKNQNGFFKNQLQHNKINPQPIHEEGQIYESETLIKDHSAIQQQQVRQKVKIPINQRISQQILPIHNYQDPIQSSPQYNKDQTNKDEFLKRTERQKQIENKRIHQKELYEEYLKNNQEAIPSQQIIKQVPEQIKDQQEKQQNNKCQNQNTQPVQSLTNNHQNQILSTDNQIIQQKNAENSDKIHTIQGTTLKSSEHLSQDINLNKLQPASQNNQVHQEQRLFITTHHNPHHRNRNNSTHIEKSRESHDKPAIKVVLKELTMIKQSIHNLTCAYRGIQYLREQIKHDNLAKKRIKQRLIQFSQEQNQFEVIRKLLKLSNQHHQANQQIKPQQRIKSKQIPDKQISHFHTISKNIHPQGIHEKIPASIIDY